MGTRLINRFVQLLFINCVVAISGCGDDASSPASFEAALDPLFCRHAAGCGEIGKSEEQQCITDRATWRTQYPAPFDKPAAITAGTLAFDSTTARTCLDAIKALVASDPCVPWDSPASLLTGATCLGVYRGQVKEAGACKYDIECQAGYCQDFSQPGCGGQCKPLIATGQSCPSGRGCHPDDVCDLRNGQICRPLHRPGDPSSPRVRAAAGETCITSLSCSAGLICAGPFQFDQNTNHGHCAPPLDVGNPCDPSIQYAGCAGDLYCDTPTSTCISRPRAGEVCNGYQDCAPHLGCDYHLYRCFALKPLGAACSYGYECDLRFCYHGVCAADVCP